MFLNEAIRAVDGFSPVDLRPASIRGVSTDSRTTRAGELFFALRGPNFDGHQFVPQAFARQAVAAIVDRQCVHAVRQALTEAGQPEPATPLIAVQNPLTALGRLAAAHRKLLAAQVIAVAGSNGKTTTKELIHHLLSARFTGRCSPKSFNNAIGVPLTLLSAEGGDDYLVVEIGTNRPGEIAALASLVQPDVAVITTIGEEHLEHLGDLAGVAAEECALLQHVRPGGFAAVNIDAPEVQPYLGSAQRTTLTFGCSDAADLRITSHDVEGAGLRFTLNNRFVHRLPVAGRHNAVNATAAIAVARRRGMDHAEIAARLETFVAPPMRNELHVTQGVTVLNDAYNANPQSALAAIETFESMPCTGRRIVVFGEMRELGRGSDAQHRRIAERLRTAAVDVVFLVGAAADWMHDTLASPGLFGPRVEACADVDDCGRRLQETVRAGDAVLLKASRAVELERVAEQLGCPRPSSLTRT